MEEDDESDGARLTYTGRFSTLETTSDARNEYIFIPIPDSTWSDPTEDLGAMYSPSGGPVCPQPARAVSEDEAVVPDTRRCSCPGPDESITDREASPQPARAVSEDEAEVPDSQTTIPITDREASPQPARAVSEDEAEVPTDISAKGCASSKPAHAVGEDEAAIQNGDFTGEFPGKGCGTSSQPARAVGEDEAAIPNGEFPGKGCGTSSQPARAVSEDEAAIPNGRKKTPKKDYSRKRANEHQDDFHPDASPRRKPDTGPPRM